MQTFSLRARLCVLLRGKRLVLVNRLMDHRLAFKDDFGEPVVLSEADFYLAYDKKELTIDVDQPYLDTVPLRRNAPPDLSCFETKHSTEALRRRAYLDALIGIDTSRLSGNTELREQIANIARTIQDGTPPSPSTVRKWATRYGLTKCVVRLVPKHTQKGRMAAIHGEIEDVLARCLEDAYLQPERPTVAHLYEEFEGRIQDINARRLPAEQLKLPSSMTVRRYIAKLDSFEVDRLREGEFAAKKKHRNAIGKLEIEKILDRWEVDHTLLDVQVVDPETGEVIGRPYLTVIIDRHSRMVMAFLLHLSAPNTESVLRTIERAIRPKQAWLEKFPKVTNEWRARGLPLYLLPDNAAEFHAYDLILAFNELGIEVLFPRSRGPEKKGGVERFFRTLAVDLIHRLPGTTFSNVQERGDYRSEQRACITLAKLEEMLTLWIVDRYLQRPHRGLNGRTPAQVWRDGESQRSPRLPLDLDSLECILAHRASVRLHHYGVEVDSQQYHCEDLVELRHRLGERPKVDVRFRDDLGHVWVRDPLRNTFLLVPNKDKRMHGLSRDLYRVARARAKKESKSKAQANAQMVLETYRTITAEAKAAMDSNKLRKRRYAAQSRLDKEGNARETPAVQPDLEKPQLALDLDIDPPALQIRPRAF